MNRQNFYNNIENSGARVIGEYINSSTPVECICQNGHSCNPRPNRIQRGEVMCRICAGNDPEAAKQNFYNNIENSGARVIGEYINSSTPVECICQNGHSCNPRPNRIQQGEVMCRICAGNDPETAKQNFYNNIKNLGGIVIGEYINSSTPVECICQNGHSCNPSPHYIQRGHGMCRICAGNDPEAAKQNFYNNIENLGGRVIGEYINSSTPVEWICRNGHFINTRPNGICRMCA
jgi:hypothetical protein